MRFFLTLLLLTLSLAVAAAPGRVWVNPPPAPATAAPAPAPQPPAAAKPSAPAVAPPAAQSRSARQPRKLDAATYHLGAGDRVKVDVFGEPDLSVELLIDSSGSVNYPLLGAIKAGGMTALELQQTIARGLSGDYLVNPEVRVMVTLFRPIFVMGQVHRAGAYPYSEGLTVEKAIAIAGGMTELASARKIYLLQEDAPTTEREKVSLDTYVLPGDTILVEEGLF